MSNNENILSIYLNEINQIPLLTREEEVALAKRAQAGEKAAKDKIVRANLRFVVNIAKKYQNSGLDLTDLISEGNIGLMMAIEHFDVGKGYHFISYAVWWIRQAILKAISEKSRMVRLPLNRANEVVKIERARKTISGRKSEDQEFAEIGLMLGMDKSHVRDMINISREMISLDAPVTSRESESTNFGEFIPDTKHDAPDEIAIASVMRSDIDSVLETLRPNEANVIRMRYGLNGAAPMSLKEVGAKCHLSKERIRQIEKSALEGMRHPARLSKLAAYVAA